MRRIACLDLDAFFVEVALKHHPELRGKPVAVCGSLTGRGVVSSASYEARPFGVRSGQPVWQAKQACPGLILVKVPNDIEECSNQVKAHLERLCPVVEAASIDEFYLDFTGCDRLYPRNLELADRLWNTIAADPALPTTIGIGTNKLIAKIASDLGKPRGVLEVLPGAESRFLAPLAVQRLPGVGPHLQTVLGNLGLQRVGEILQVPIEAWQATLGKTGEHLFQRAQGLCESPVIASDGIDRRRQISRDTTLSEDTSSLELLQRIFSRLVEEATNDLRRAGLTCGGLAVKLRYTDFSTVTRSSKVERTNLDTALFRIGSRLLEALFTRRLKVRLVGVRLYDLQPGGITPTLWEILETEERRQLPEMVDRIRSRFGIHALHRARSLVPSRSKDRQGVH